MSKRAVSSKIVSAGHFNYAATVVKGVLQKNRKGMLKP